MEDWSLDDWLWNDSELVRAAAAVAPLSAALTRRAQLAQPVGAAPASAPQVPSSKGAPRKPRRLAAHSARLVCQVRGCSAALDALRPYNQRTRCARQQRKRGAYRDASS